MPFQSLAQLRTCYAKHDPRWNCDQWAKETDLSSLKERSPKKQHQTTKKSKISGGNLAKSKIYTGPRGGRYFYLTQGGTRVKIYVR